MDKHDLFQAYFDACDSVTEEDAHPLFGGGAVPEGAVGLTGIEAQPVFTLPEALALLEDEELMLAIELYDLSDEAELGLEALDREQLLARATEALSNPAIHEINLRSIPTISREHYLWLAREGVYEHPLDQAAEDMRRILEADDEAEIQRIVSNMERGATIEALAGEMLVFPFVHDGLVTFVMPNEIREACLSVATEEFLAYAEAVELATAYIDAATNLYGVIAVEDVIDLMAAYEPDIDAAAAADLVVEALEVNQLWPRSVENGFVAHELFREGVGLGEQMAFELLSIAAETPRYQPDRETFLSYAYPDFDEENFEAELLYELLVDLYPDSDVDEAFQMVQFVQQCARQGMRNEIIVESLFEDMLPQPLANEGQASLLIKQIAKLVHTTRTWAFNGHSPEEVEQK